MKKNNVAKRFGIASLCLATAFSAVSGIASLGNNVTVANATTLGNTIATKDFAKETEGDINVEPKARSVDGTETTCLDIESDGPYKATLQTVFTGNTTFKFKFPEVGTKAAGDFKIRVTDVDDAKNYFDIVYYVGSSGYTHVAANYNGNIRVVNYTKSPNGIYTSYHKSAIRTSPVLNSYCNGNATYAAKEGDLQLVWSSGVLNLQTYNMQYSAAGKYFAKFDGTDSKADSGVSAFGLPKLSFENGYTVTVISDYETGTDVSFSSITSNGKTYTFSEETITVDNYMRAYATLEEPEAGKVFLGWKDADNKLYSIKTVGAATAFAYEPVYFGFDTTVGASIRINTSSEGASSGLRFQTYFDQAAIADVENCITGFGTVVARTDKLTTNKYFGLEDYATDTWTPYVKQVPNTKDKFDLTTGGKTYKAYTMAIVDLTEEHYGIAYSARGYLEVAYADGVTQKIYTDYIKDDNSRSIAQTAQNLIDKGATEYSDYMSILESYAAAIQE